MSAVVSSILEGSQSGTTIHIECQLSNGLPSIVIVGFANKSIDEAKERVRSAFASAKLQLPRKRITVNLAPADIPKDGTSFDLAIAAVILAASGQIKSPNNTRTMILGELGLDSSVRPVRGIIGKLAQARATGFTTFYIPANNMQQAQLVPGITLIAVTTLHELYTELAGSMTLKRVETGAGLLSDMPRHVSGQDFREIVGQKRAKRAMEIAAAGMHNILLNGPPGAGKSMLAKALPTILPEMEHEEILEVTHLHSLAGKNYEETIVDRPFRAPHHTASNTAIIGGGTNPRPGEISLSHRGVLFFDEFPEFNRPTIEALRQPLEDRTITVARARDTLTFPADFILVATANPCPCGYYGTSKTCSCMPHQIQKYQKKLSGPIIDRIDLYVDVDEVRHSKLLDSSDEEPSKKIRERILAARKRQALRYNNQIKHNAGLSNKDIKTLVTIDPAAQDLLNTAAERLGISARSYMRTIKVAQTIADLEGSDMISPAHISEALQYRKPSTDML